MTYAVARIEDPYRRRSDGNELPVGTFVQASIEGTLAEDVVGFHARLCVVPIRLSLWTMTTSF